MISHHIHRNLATLNVSFFVNTISDIIYWNFQILYNIRFTEYNPLPSPIPPLPPITMLFLCLAKCAQLQIPVFRSVCKQWKTITFCVYNNRKKSGHKSLPNFTYTSMATIVNVHQNWTTLFRGEGGEEMLFS